jgi:hypothetical protein
MTFLWFITATQRGCRREILGILKCLSKFESLTDVVCTACAKKTNKEWLMPFKQLFSNHNLSRITQPYNVSKHTVGQKSI